MNFFEPDPVDCFNVGLFQQAAVQPLREVHTGAAFGKLLQQFLMVWTGQQIRVQQLDMALPVPKFSQVSGFDAAMALLFTDHAERTVTGAAPCQETIGCVRELGIDAVIRHGVFYSVRELCSKAVSGSPADNEVRIVDRVCVF